MSTFITTQELIEFTPIQAIKSRAATLLAYDILEAEVEIKAICGHDFSDAVTYPTIPAEVKLACLKLAQYYSILNSDEDTIKQIKSQNIGDFSFSTDGVKKPEVLHLLKAHIKSASTDGNVELRLRLL